VGTIVSLSDLANSLQMPVVNDVGNVLIELAEGKVIQKVGDHAPWTPAVEFATPRSVVLAAAGRALRNPKGVTEKQVDAVRDKFNAAERLGVYLTPEEKNELAEWLADQEPDTVTPNPGEPAGCFPEPLCYPDPARGPRYTGNALTDYGY
jgi:hypothetical protein